ncbi:MAG: chemotaxis protein CheB [Rhodanobacteraceae bacterium]
MRNTQSNIAVALLYQTQELGRHMRDALSSLGTPIVYEAATDHLDSNALHESGARVVVVNLDPAVEAHLDQVYDLLENDRYSVVFNDAQVTNGLSGWDQARWVRHLAAKILGDVDIDPPRPEGAETIPAPSPVALAVVAAPVESEDATDEHTSVEALMESASQYAFANRDAPAAAEAAHNYAAVDTVAKASDPRDVLESRFDELNQPAASTLPSPPRPPDEGFDFSTLEALTASVAAPPAAEDHSQMFAPEFVDEAQPVVAADVEDASGAVDSRPVEDVFDLAALDALFGDEPPATSARVEEELSEIDVGDLGDFGTIELESTADAANDVEPVEVSAPNFTLMDDEDFDSAPAAPVEQTASPELSPNLAAAADWSLEDMLEGDAAPPPVPTAANEFGIEKVSAAEYLAPQDEGTALPAPIALDDFEFELMPMEDAVAPQAVQREPHEAWLDPDKISVPAVAKIRRVWVLGASIGGPEAVREFLSELPRDYPALFLLAQHMGAEFVDLMAQQLAKATALTVRTPTHGERVGHGEVVIVPTTHRLQVDPEGFVVLERSAGDAAYAPSIDRVMQDAADRYGASAGAIIFSGMTTDAVEGSKYVAGKGGTVYAQHPDSCVVSSMVDGAIEAGIVKVLGTPRELAGLLLADSAKK